MSAILLLKSPLSNLNWSSSLFASAVIAFFRVPKSVFIFSISSTFAWLLSKDSSFAIACSSFLELLKSVAKATIPSITNGIT